MHALQRILFKDRARDYAERGAEWRQRVAALRLTVVSDIDVVFSLGAHTRKRTRQCALEAGELFVSKELDDYAALATEIVSLFYSAVEQASADIVMARRLLVTERPRTAKARNGPTERRQLVRLGAHLGCEGDIGREGTLSCPSSQNRSPRQP